MNKRLEIILEICVRNELNFMDVMQIYTKANCRIYSQSVKKRGEATSDPNEGRDKKSSGEKFQLYNPVLEEKTMGLVERYFDIKRVKELNKNKYL